MKIKVGSKTLTIRKWKGLDKKKFIDGLKADTVDEKMLMNTLVYSCVEEDVVLSVDEFRYVLSRIRAYSLGEEFEVEFYCESCGHVYKKTFELKDVIKYSFNEVNEIKSGNVTIKLTDIRNKEIYIEKIAEDDIYDFLLRVEAFNGDDTFKLEELVDKFYDLDVDIMEDILQQYNNNKFKLIDVCDVTCEKCGTVAKFIFDEIPNFFPITWFE